MFTCFGQYNPARRTHEQACTQFVFQLANLHANRRLRDVYALGSGRESAGFGDCDERS
jgi:hypothetical protein